MVKKVSEEADKYQWLPLNVSPVGF